MQKIFFYIGIIIILPCASLYAQKDKRLIRQGNKEYEKQQYNAAETSYLKAIEVNPESIPATYNLAETRYRQDSLNQAIQHWSATAWNQTADQNLRANSFYNIGNAMMKAADYQKSIELYKQSLRINPNDEDARYNLAYAQKMLKNQQNQQDKQKNGGKNDQQQDNKNQDQQNQQEQDQQQDNKQDQQNTQNQQQNQQQQQQAQQNISKEEAERMLEAMKNNEKKTLEKVKQQQIGKPQKTEKDW